MGEYYFFSSCSSKHSIQGTVWICCQCNRQHVFFLFFVFRGILWVATWTRRNRILYLNSYSLDSKILVSAYHSPHYLSKLVSAANLIARSWIQSTVPIGGGTRKTRLKLAKERSIPASREGSKECGKHTALLLQLGTVDKNIWTYASERARGETSPTTSASTVPSCLSCVQNLPFSGSIRSLRNRRSSTPFKVFFFPLFPPAKAAASFLWSRLQRNVCARFCLLPF